MHYLGSRPHPALPAMARLSVRPTAEAVLRRVGAGAEAPDSATETAW
ncbi:hypothetical protein P376_1249 [Streptomyces sp. HCCB10043]|uniref:Predicted protein n=1 Tax=Streptomyces filamentosus NRRL 15998 TaxID=457431 RepID=D6AGZ9_STRFL|nr:predicted protein [Streptomyces filamentosus NRRL 15998]ESU50771.1 hypothetical protein P376_1249 [Streptomyces sp. HCCB10043]